MKTSIVLITDFSLLFFLNVCILEGLGSFFPHTRCSKCIFNLILAQFINDNWEIKMFPSFVKVFPPLFTLDLGASLSRSGRKTDDVSTCDLQQCCCDALTLAECSSEPSLASRTRNRHQALDCQ